MEMLQPIEQVSADLVSAGAKADRAFHERLTEILKEEILQRIESKADLSLGDNLRRTALYVLERISKSSLAKTAALGFVEYDIEMKNDLSSRFYEVSRYISTLSGSQLYELLGLASKEPTRTGTLLRRILQYGTEAVKHGARLSPVFEVPRTRPIYRLKESTEETG